jgi:hypothetical protein
MKDLIERLEKATGPDRVLDGAIFCACAPRMAECWPHWSKQERLDMPAHYTSSVDAALTLVPEGWGISQLEDERENEEDPDKITGCYVRLAGPSRCGFASTIHHTRAIALCIAALKARAVSENGRSEAE